MSDLKANKFLTVIRITEYKQILYSRWLVYLSSAY